RYINHTMHDIAGEIEFKPDGIVQNRAADTLSKACRLLEQIERTKLFATIEQGIFAGIKRGRDAGKGLDGVVLKADGYFNPFMQLMLDTEEHDEKGEGK
ncbi:MAG: D-lysine 5,6-aminomutase subunit alpha, partial [Defluviitaleaceae bacterium]|nr:D-lysine 5,6-aminomutase subunit alpha [Defluviitaleaceae bacterium]